MDIGDTVEIHAKDIVDETESETGVIIGDNPVVFDYVIEVEDNAHGGVRHMDVREDEISVK